MLYNAQKIPDVAFSFSDWQNKSWNIATVLLLNIKQDIIFLPMNNANKTEKSDSVT